MTQILLIEDDENKAARLEQCLCECQGVTSILRKRSYQSGLRELVSSRPTLAIIDMTMPTYDVSSEEKGWKTLHYAGREILDELKRRNIKTRAIVVTQFESFGEGPDFLTLDELRERLARDFRGQYISTIFYQASDLRWRSELQRAVRDALQSERRR